MKKPEFSYHDIDCKCDKCKTQQIEWRNNHRSKVSQMSDDEFLNNITNINLFVIKDLLINFGEKVHSKIMERNQWCFKYIAPVASKEIILNAMNKDGYYIQHVNNPDFDIQMAAVKNNICAASVIKDIDPEVKEYAMSEAKKNKIGWIIKHLES